MKATIFSWLSDWSHLVEKPISVSEVEQTVIRGSLPAFSFYFMLVVSAVIATLGLLADSAAVIIGAMIIAPLMSPIIAMSFGLVARKGMLILRSLVTITAGSILTIIVALIITNAIGWNIAGPEVVARMRPSLLDLGVAVAAGMAAAYAYTLPGISASLAGIAIAVALVPPLCTVGIALGLGNEASVEVGVAWESFSVRGPLLLYLTNIVGIVFAGSMIFYWQYFRRRILALAIIFLTLVSVVIIVPPLEITMDKLLIRNQVRRNLIQIALSLIPSYEGIRMTNLSIQVEQDLIHVRCDIVSPPGKFTQELVNIFRDKLTEMIERPVVLEMGIINEFVLRSSKENGG